MIMLEINGEKVTLQFRLTNLASSHRTPDNYYHPAMKISAIDLVYLSDEKFSFKHEAEERAFTLLEEAENAATSVIAPHHLSVK